MICSVASPIGRSDLSKVRVYSLDGPRSREDKVGIYGCHQRSRHLVRVIDGVGQMHANRSDVAHRQSQTPGELTLNIQIPLPFIGAVGIEFNMGSLRRARKEQTHTLVRERGR